MKKTSDYQVGLVAPHVWQTVLDASFKILDLRQRRVARLVLTAMHNRHVGITPVLAAEMAPLLLDLNAHSEGIWDEVIVRLICELTPKVARNTRQKAGNFGLLPNLNPLYVVFRLIMPVVDQACRVIGRCYLFCEDELSGTITHSQYDRYAGNLAREIRRLADINARDSANSLELFWRDRALTLSSLSRRFFVPDPKTAGLPASDFASLAFLLRLETDMPRPKKNPQRVRTLISSARFRKSHIQREGGVDRIHLSRREEDINRILHSEFINAPVVLADRLINTGYFAIQREPKHEKLRDVLIAAVIPGVFHSKLNSGFIKACWFESVMRLSFILGGQKLYKSEFRLFEGDRFGRLRICKFSLEEMYSIKSVSDRGIGPTAAYRHGFLSALRWLPSYLDTQDRFEFLAPESSGKRYDKDSSSTKLDALQKWAFRAWAHQKGAFMRTHRPAAPGMRSPNNNNRPNFEEFAYIHIMLFLPADEQARDKTDKEIPELGLLFKGFGIGNYPGRNVSITRVPARILDLDNWTFTARGHPVSPIFTKNPVDCNDANVAGELEKTWFNQWLKEIWRE